MEKTTSPRDVLTVMVFKDTDSSRTLEIPMGWFSRLGWAVFALCCVTAFSVGWAIRVSVLTPKPEAAPAQSPAPEVVPAPAVVAPAQPAAPVASLAAPAFFSSPLKEVDSRAIAIDSPTIKWNAARRIWQVSFQFKYLPEDGGKQNGEFILIASGPQHLMTYPEGTLAQPGSAPFVIDLSQGESFSVGRIRGVSAEFGPLAEKADLNQLRILAFNTEGEMILDQSLDLKVEAEGKKTKRQQDHVDAVEGN